MRHLICTENEQYKQSGLPYAVKEFDYVMRIGSPDCQIGDKVEYESDRSERSISV